MRTSVNETGVSDTAAQKAGGQNTKCTYTRLITMVRHKKKTKTKLRGRSPQANYTDQVTAACRRS
jgi:hypothetical protein